MYHPASRIWRDKVASLHFNKPRWSVGGSEGPGPRRAASSMGMDKTDVPRWALLPALYALQLLAIGEDHVPFLRIAGCRRDPIGARPPNVQILVLTAGGASCIHV